jgi:hypothetical protein
MLVISNWKRRYPAFANALLDARQMQVHSLFDKLMNVIEDDTLAASDVPIRRLQTDLAKWLMERLSPKEWAAKNQLEVNAPTQIIVNTGISREPLPEDERLREDTIEVDSNESG